MKKHLALVASLTSVLSLGSFNAFGGNEGPQASPILPKAPVIARETISSFFVPPSSPTSTVIEITVYGVGTLTKEYRDGRIEKTTIATLSDALASKVANAAVQVQPSPLVDPNPHQPGCEDAPSFRYAAVRPDGSEIPVAEKINCKPMEKQNATPADATVEAALEAMSQLANLP